jgi:hypothetical protein
MIDQNGPKGTGPGGPQHPDAIAFVMKLLLSGCAFLWVRICVMLGIMVHYAGGFWEFIHILTGR